MNLTPLRPEPPAKCPRWSYHHNSRNFIGWVNKLGIERTFAGRVAHYLDSKLRLKRLALLFIYSLALSFFISWDLSTNYAGYKEGQIANHNVRSPVGFDVLDQDRTDARKDEAAAAVPAVYDYDVGYFDQLVGRVRLAFKNMRQIQSGFKAPRDPEAIANLQSDFEAQLGGPTLPRSAFLYLLKEKFSGATENILVQNLQRLGNQKIFDDGSPFRGASPKRVTVKIVDQGTRGEEFSIDPVGIPDADTVRSRLPLEGPLREVLRSLVSPNLRADLAETEARREKARREVPPVYVAVQKGQLVVREGEPLQKLQVASLLELRRLRAMRHQDFVSLMTAVFFLILLLCFSRYLSRANIKIAVSVKDAVAMGSILFLVVAIAKFILFISNTALVDHFLNVPISFYSYLLPASTGAMMVGLLIPVGEVVWLFSFFSAVALGLLLDRSFTFMIVTFATNVMAARGVIGCKKREDLYRAGITTGIVNAALIFSVTLMGHFTSEVLRLELLWNVPAGFVSGLLAGFATLMLLPLWETIFVYTTDVKLLELSNLNHPLLKDMIVKAPGTYHHSLVVGNMCEAAAEAIGANPLLAKVCAYYHDIGKTNHALYFIENQRPGENRHDHINPGMSKTILIAHVKDGVELALKYKLGKPIMEVIEQHHGNTLISFFYHRAKESEDLALHEVTEDEYRYPGPKPTFPESALCMLADSIEAAARSLDEPTPARLQAIVHNIIQKKFLDGQLNDCNITLRDLSVIEQSFSKILMSIYHQRIDYPTTLKAPSSRGKEQTVS